MAKGNEFTLRANVVSDSEQSGNGPVKFSVAWNKARKVDNEWQTTPHYFDVVYWERERSFAKGDRVLITGYMEQQRWQDKETGKNRSKVQLVADEVAIVPKRIPDGESSDSSAQGEAETPSTEEIPF